MVGRQVQLGLLLLVAPVLYQLHRASHRREAEEELLGQLAANWEETITAPERRISRVAVGVNSNLDLIVSATPLLEALGLSPGQPADHTHLSTGVDLEGQVSHSMLHCAGTERVFTSQEEFQRVVTTAYQLPHTHFVGGNAALMAAKIQQTQPDTQVMLAGPIGSILRDLLQPDILTPTFTPDSRDEVHLIMEYPKGQRWGDITASCANRVIISHDISNGKMVALEAFQTNIQTFQPELVILSGAHLMQGEEEGFRKKRLSDVSNLLNRIPTALPVHSELATIGDLAYLKDLADASFSRVDSLGLNEQELISLAKASGARFDFESIPAKPEIPIVSDLLHWLMKTYSCLRGRESRLTRVHFHTLSFHILATVTQPAGRWRNTESAVLAGSRVAGLQACDLERFDATKFELRVPLDFPVSALDEVLSRQIVHITPDSPVGRWQREGVEYVATPVLVCRAPLKTVGLGDAISSMGLLYSEFIIPDHS